MNNTPVEKSPAESAAPTTPVKSAPPATPAPKPPRIWFKDAKTGERKERSAG